MKNKKYTDNRSNPVVNFCLAIACVLIVVVVILSNYKSYKIFKIFDCDIEESQEIIAKPNQEYRISSGIEVELKDVEKDNSIEDASAEESVIPDQYEMANINSILQNPELPTGCEVTSLAIVLNYLGYNVEKTTLSDSYLDKAAIGTATAYTAFLGNPRYEHSYGCYAPVIVNCANKYLSDIESNYIATDISGLEFEDLYEYIVEDIPVIVWSTMYMSDSYTTTTWNVNGEDFAWIANEHCVVLYGYDKYQNTVSVSDPLVGNTKYDIELFKDRYNQLLKQAVIITEK